MQTDIGLYSTRTEAGRVLAGYLAAFDHDENAIILALPRGGIPVASAMANQLDLPWDIFLIRKLGVPSQPELAFGAIALGGICYLNQDLIRSLGISADIISAVMQREQIELERRDAIYRQGKSMPNFIDKKIIVVDDGIATGASMEAAVMALREYQPAEIIIAVPVASPDICKQLLNIADDVICPLQPESLMAVGYWYEQFDQLSDQEVMMWLADRG